MRGQDGNSRDPFAHERERWPGAEPVAFASLAALFAVLCSLQIFYGNLNWDEFNFLAEIHSYHAERLATPLQTFHVHLFSWLPLTGTGEANQIVIGRTVMVLPLAGTCVAVFLIARRLFEASTAMLVVSAYIASGYVLVHGASFRTDPLVACAMMTAIALLLLGRSRPALAVLAGTFAAIGLLVSLKGVFYLPAFLGALVWRMGRVGPREAIGHFTTAGAAFVLAGVLLWSLHGASLVSIAPLKSQAGGAYAALDKTITSQALFPRAFYIERWVLEGPVSAILVGAGIALTLAAALRRLERNRAITTLLMAAPLLSLVFYRNAFPYFFAFLMPPAIIVTGYAVQLLPSAKFRLAIYAVFAVALSSNIPTLIRHDQSAQRDTIAAVHLMFSEPVPYIDRAGMIPSFPKVGFFMSTWGIEVARSSGKPALINAIERNVPPLVIANTHALDYALTGEGTAPTLRLHEKDEAMLRSSYIHHWGAIWVTGKHLNVDHRETAFDLVVPGYYTLECIGSELQIDSVTRRCWDVVELTNGRHVVTAASPSKVTLRYGDHLARPTLAAPERPIFYPL